MSPEQWAEITHVETLARLLAQGTKTPRRPGDMDAPNRIDRWLWRRDWRPLTEAEDLARPARLGVGEWEP